MATGVAIGIADDLFRPFRLERTALRGRLVRLGDLIDGILTRHAYPEPVSRQLGELLVLAATFAGGLKVAGTFSLQVKSEGPVSLMVADCTSDGVMRAYAQFDRDAVAAAEREVGETGLDRLLARGHLALTVDQPSTGQTHQGLVELEGTSLTECMQAYFRHSEQLRTALRVAVGRVETADGGHWRAGGILVQPLADEVADSLDERQLREDWRRTMIYLSTVTDTELTDPGLAPDGLLWRLFHEEGVRVFEPQALRFGCRCTRARVETLLRSFPPEELADMREPDGGVVVACQFCNTGFGFGEAELAGLLEPVGP
jgi:molecular chaperone Hsp33